MAASPARNSRRLAAAGGRSCGLAWRGHQGPQPGRSCRVRRQCARNARLWAFCARPSHEPGPSPLVRGIPSFCWPPSFRQKISSLRAPPLGRLFRMPAALDPAAMIRGWRARRRVQESLGSLHSAAKSFSSGNRGKCLLAADRRGSPWRQRASKQPMPTRGKGSSKGKVPPPRDPAVGLSCAALTTCRSWFSP